MRVALAESAVPSTASGAGYTVEAPGDKDLNALVGRAPVDSESASGDTDPALSDISPRVDKVEPESKEGQWIVLPVGGYSPETSVQLGGVGVRYWYLDPKSRPSSVPLVVLVTTRQQLITDLQPELYWGDDTYRFWAELEVQRFPDRFYGVGNAVRETDRESFLRTFGRLRMNLRRRVIDGFSAGLATDHQWVGISDRQAGGKLATGSVPGAAGGFTSGLGLSFAFDTRDNRSYPTRGLFLDATGVALLPVIGSDYEFVSLKFDNRAYIGFGERHVLALRYVFHSTPGAPPFYMLPELGGANLLRGYYGGKYRDKVLQVAEAEYRVHLIWRFGAVAFAGVGQVARRLDEVPKGVLRPTVGGGLRINLADEDIVNLRCDVGYWPGTFGFYFSMLEAF
jgi:Omp85 superfamily domain